MIAKRKSLLHSAGFHQDSFFLCFCDQVLSCSKASSRLIATGRVTPVRLRSYSGPGTFAILHFLYSSSPARVAPIEELCV